MFKKVAFTMFPVQDAARARSFYEDTLGLKRGSSSPEGTWTEYDLPGGGCLALFRTQDIQPSADAGGSVAFEVEDLDLLSEQLRAKGVEFRAEKIQSPVCRMSIIKDSEGNAIILHQLARRSGARPPTAPARRKRPSRSPRRGGTARKSGSRRAAGKRKGS